MECPCCGRSYSNSQPDTFPRVLLLCGHTFCHRCVSSQLKANSILCYTCGRVSTGSTVDTFPINQTLLNIISGKKVASDPVCKQHGRRLQIYCEKDEMLLCSECLIQSHKHHKMCTITAKVERDRAELDECLKRVEEGLEFYRSEKSQADSDEIRIHEEFLNCESEANLFYKTVKEEVERLREREIVRLEGRRGEIAKQLGQHRNDLEVQISFMDKIINEYFELTNMSETDFLLKSNMRDFIAKNSLPKKMKYSPPSLQFKRGPCLQEIARSVQQMMQLQSNRNAVASSVLTLSPSIKKSKQPAILQVNLCEEYQKRKGTGSFQKAKPPKKTISIHQAKVSESVGSARNNSFNGKQGRPCSARRSRQNRQLQELLQEEELNLSQNFTPLASVHSFMRSSRNSEVNSSLIDDTTLRNTFADFSVLEGEETIYHLGGLSSCETERYYPETRHSERLSASSSQFKGQKAHCVILRAYPDRCLIMGGVTNMKQPSSDIYEFSFRDYRIAKSSLRLQHPRAGVACLGRGTDVFVVGGRRDRPLNSFDRYHFDGKSLCFSAMPGMLHPREQLGCCLGFDGRLYAIGGVGLGNEAIVSAQFFNWEKEQWEGVEGMRQSRMNFAIVSTPRGIYAIGGHTNKQYLSEVQFFDLEQRRWVQCAPLRHPRSYHTAVLSRDYQTISVFGGLYENKQLDSIEVYDIQRNEWSSGGTMKAKRCLHVSVACPK